LEFYFEMLRSVSHRTDGRSLACGSGPVVIQTDLSCRKIVVVYQPKRQLIRGRKEVLQDVMALKDVLRCINIFTPVEDFVV